MPRLGLLVVVWLGLMAVAPPAGAQRVATEKLPSVVAVEAGDRSGAGFAYRSDRRVITAEGVIGAEASARLTLHGGAVVDADVLAADAERGIAVLRASRPIPPLEPRFNPRRGERVFALGSPLGFADEVDAGTLDRVRTRVRGYDGGRVISSDLQPAPPDVGGPVIDIDGRVVGINTVISGGRAEGTPLVLPASMISRVEIAQGITSAFPLDDEPGSSAFRLLLVAVLALGGAAWLARTRIRGSTNPADPQPDPSVSVDSDDATVVIVRRSRGRGRGRSG